MSASTSHKPQQHNPYNLRAIDSIFSVPTGCGSRCSENCSCRKSPGRRCRCWALTCQCIPVTNNPTTGTGGPDGPLQVGPYGPCGAPTSINAPVGQPLFSHSCEVEREVFDEISLEALTHEVTAFGPAPRNCVELCLRNIPAIVSTDMLSSLLRSECAAILIYRNTCFTDSKNRRSKGIHFVMIADNGAAQELMAKLHHRVWFNDDMKTAKIARNELAQSALENMARSNHDLPTSPLAVEWSRSELNVHYQGSREQQQLDSLTLNLHSVQTITCGAGHFSPAPADAIEICLGQVPNDLSTNETASLLMQVCSETVIYRATTHIDKATGRPKGMHFFLLKNNGASQILKAKLNERVWFNDRNSVTIAQTELGLRKLQQLSRKRKIMARQNKVVDLPQRPLTVDMTHQQP